MLESSGGDARSDADRYLRAWLADGAYYRMRLQPSARPTTPTSASPEKDDTSSRPEPSACSPEALRAVVTLVTFRGDLSGALRNPHRSPVGGFSIPLPGYMVWVAVHRPRSPARGDRLARPARSIAWNFPIGCGTRPTSDSPARRSASAEDHSRGPLSRGRGGRGSGLPRYGSKTWCATGGASCSGRKRATYLHPGFAGWGRGSSPPTIVATPRFFRGELGGLGGLMQTRPGLSAGQDALGFFVQSYKEIAALVPGDRAARRLRARARPRDHACRRWAASRAPRGARHAVDRGGCPKPLSGPDGQLAYSNINLSLVRGDTVLLLGASRLGEEYARACHRRHLAVRAWRDSHAAGRPDPVSPQRPYLPIGMLRDVVSYPMAARGVADEILREALDVVGLTELAGRLHEVRPLGASALARRAATHGLRAGPGPEARMALRRGDLSGGRGDGGAPLSAGCASGLGGTTVFSIGHRPTLRLFHARRLMVQRAGNAPPPSWSCPPRGTSDRGTALSCTTKARVLGIARLPRGTTRTR